MNPELSSFVSRRGILLALSVALLLGAPTAKADSGQVFWIESNNNGLVRSAWLDGTHVTNLVTNAGYLRGMALDATAGRIYWSVQNNNLPGAIFSSNLDGSGVQFFTSTGVNPTSIALDKADGFIYWTNYDDDTIERANLDGTGRTTILTLPVRSQPLSIAVDSRDGQIYWTQALDQPKGPAIRRAALDGSGVQDLVTTGLHYPTTIQLDLRDNEIYWADTGGSIGRSGLGGSDVQQLVSGLNVPNGLSLDLNANRMYWTEYYTGLVSSADLDGANIKAVVAGTDGGCLDELAVLPEPSCLALATLGNLVCIRRRYTGR